MPEPREIKKVSKMLQSLFNIFAVTKLTNVELDNYEEHLNKLKLTKFISDDAYDIEMRKSGISKRIVSLIEDIDLLAKKNMR